MICRLSLLSISTFWDSYNYYRIGFFQGIFISFWSNIFESLLLYYVSCTNCEVFDKKKDWGSSDPPENLGELSDSLHQALSEGEGGLLS